MLISFFYRSYLLRHIRLRSFAVFKNVKLNSLRGAGAKRGVGRGRKAQKGCQSQIPSPFSLLSPPLLTHEVRNMTIATVVQRLKHKYLYGGKTIVTVAYKCVSRSHLSLMSPSILSKLVPDRSLSRTTTLNDMGSGTAQDKRNTQLGGGKKSFILITFHIRTTVTIVSPPYKSQPRP